MTHGQKNIKNLQTSSSLNVGDQISHPHKTAGKVMVDLNL
jgi:hypothetical protein